MGNLLNTALALAVGALSYFLIRLFQIRSGLRALPGPPVRSILLGHLDVLGPTAQHFPKDTHPHAFAHYIRTKFKLGKLFYVDAWPLGPRSLFIADPEIANQITTNNSLPKSPLVNEYLHQLLGTNNMVSLEGHRWKALRSIFNPGFSTAHLMTLVPYIVDQSLVFCEVMREKAKAGELFEMEEYATRLTVDIIGKVVLESDFNAQKVDNAIVSTFRKHVLIMPPTTGINPFLGIDPFRVLKVWISGRKLDRLIGEELDKKFASKYVQKQSNGSAEKTKKDRKRSVVDLALEAYQKESGSTLEATRTGMDAAFRKNSIDSIKTFIFAGHDTTSSTIAYIFYFMHLYPSKHRSLVEELTAVFGPDLNLTADLIRANPYLINKLDYTTAIIKETLRLFPPASTLRDIAGGPNLTLTDPDTGEHFPLKGWTIWPVAHLIHRNERFFPHPTEFIPERFLPDKTPFPEAELFLPAGKDAWRPFEKGPRNCIGQELAMIETKVILALTVREFDFTAEYDGIRCETVTTCESVDEAAGAETVEGHRCYQVLKGSAKPVGGLPGRIKLR